MLTGVLLVFAALAMTCIPGETSKSLNGCNEVTPESFEELKKETRPHRPAYILGKFCEKTHEKGESRVTCLGYAVQGPPNCPFCCACQDDAETIDYNKKGLPRSYPCRNNRPK
uniref:Putative ixostatin n=1 Tax=Ixodes ricinus TaxID=34613 RepID=A0A0K8RC67_IXORI